MSELERRSALDNKLLSMARKSPQEIAEATGLKPEEVASRVKKLLAARDWLTEREEERLILIEAADLKEQAMDALSEARIGEDWSSVANVALKSLKLVADRLDARRKLVDSDIQRITQHQAKLFGDAFEVALIDVVDTIRALGEVPGDEDVYEIARKALEKAGRQLDKSVNYE
jgi:DNA-binding Lrp family transcriptional regulator